ncbi:DedA family protein [Thermoactinomyces daqus]|uniref:DedA family protein n=1 Tax=Thermoactinomyces daqus TaxID=1329516 RepID=UPI00068E8EE9|nr:DedA family protein [Thermoactinomyces daqus]
METAQLIHWISEYGCFALFLFLWLGILGVPIPDEVIVMTGGLVSTYHILQPIPSFTVTYLGVISGLSIGYIGGRVSRSTVYDKLLNKKKLRKHLIRAERLLTKYGSFALCFSYFTPVIRHLVPYLAGSLRMPYPRYALFSYGAGFVWTAIYFTVGYQFGDSIAYVAKLSRDLGHLTLGIAAVMFLLLLIRSYAQRKNEKEKRIHEAKHHHSNCR